MRNSQFFLNFARPARAESGSPVTQASSKVLIYESEAERVARLTLQYPDTETGGDLFGYWTHSGSPVVSFIIGPGLNSRHHDTSFYQDVDYLHDLGIDLYDRHGLQHIGEWHSHHKLGLNRPSGGDVETVRSGMRAKGWPNFLLLIATVKDEDSAVLNCFLFREHGRVHEPTRILLLPGASPFRDGSHDGREEPFRREVAAVWEPGPDTPENNPPREPAGESPAGKGVEENGSG